MTVEVLRQIQPHEAWVTIEVDPEHLPRLAFVPVGPSEHRGDTGTTGILVIDGHVDIDVNRASLRIEMDEDLHSTPTIAPSDFAAVHARQEGKEAALQRPIPQRGDDIEEVFTRTADVELIMVEMQLGNAISKELSSTPQCFFWSQPVGDGHYPTST
jgi:hypothetical protein